MRLKRATKAKLTQDIRGDWWSVFLNGPKRLWSTGPYLSAQTALAAMKRRRIKVLSVQPFNPDR
jgi:hypothetical protein